MRGREVLAIFTYTKMTIMRAIYWYGNDMK